MHTRQEKSSCCTSVLRGRVRRLFRQNTNIGLRPNFLFRRRSTTSTLIRTFLTSNSVLRDLRCAIGNFQRIKQRRRGVDPNIRHHCDHFYYEVIIAGNLRKRQVNTSSPYGTRLPPRALNRRDMKRQHERTILHYVKNNSINNRCCINPDYSSDHGELRFHLPRLYPDLNTTNHTMITILYNVSITQRVLRYTRCTHVIGPLCDKNRRLYHRYQVQQGYSIPSRNVNQVNIRVYR